MDKFGNDGFQVTGHRGGADNRGGGGGANRGRGAFRGGRGDFRGGRGGGQGGQRGKSYDSGENSTKFEKIQTDSRSLPGSLIWRLSRW